MTHPEPELFRHIGPRPTRPGVDLAKLARLQASRREGRAVIDSLNDQRHADRADIQHAETFFSATPAAAAFWRVGDSTAIFAEMTGDQAERFKHEAQAARDIAQKKTALVALTARIDQLAARQAQLNRLVAACEAYAYSKE